MNLDERYNRWFEIADCITDIIDKIEAEIDSNHFSEPDDRQALSKINKKMYEALEIAQKVYLALEALEENDNA